MKKEKKKIIHLLPSNKLSGAENVIITIMENFKDEYDMYYCSPTGPIKKDLEKRNLKYIPLKNFSKKEVKKILKEYKPDILQAHDYKASIMAAFTFKGPIISQIHCSPKFAESWNVYTIIYGILSKRFKKVIGVSNSVYQKAVYKKCIREKYQTIYNFVDKDTIIKKAKEYKFKDTYDIYFFGRLSKEKNPMLFVDVIKELKKEQNNIKAIMLGDGPLKKETIDYIKQNRLSNNICVHGFAENPYPIINKCKVQIMTSISEGLPLSVVESLILNKPVINSGVNGLSEIFENNEEFICKDIKDYVNCYKHINYSKNYTEISKKFTDKEKWKKEFKNIYNSL